MFFVFFVMNFTNTITYVTIIGLCECRVSPQQQLYRNNKQCSYLLFSILKPPKAKLVLREQVLIKLIYLYNNHVKCLIKIKLILKTTVYNNNVIFIIK